MTIKFKVAVDYREKRRAEYPSIEDQLDALWKGGIDLDTMRQRVLAVKTKYPKPKGEPQS